ncbi:sulfotransferase family protein [Ostreiculturibacter nitratireducens]|uniref:sulfotransferase family protein n=1 Tax=Ostreiculturibacter nitratireducens TaxID=3075226 RepID=UPI0031B58600
MHPFPAIAPAVARLRGPDPVEGAPTLLFCVGATKAGTSWLYDYLSGHPDCHLRGTKELHYFDCHDLDATWARSDVKARIARIEEALASAGPARALDLAAELADLKALLKLLRKPVDEAAYVAYLTEGRGEEKLVADITPAYSLLSAERLRGMAALLPDVRFLYILRDPVARLWSHVRMMARRRDGEGKVARGRAARILDGVIAGRETEIAVRSDYRGALERLNAAVDPSRVLVAFYEELLTVPGIRAVCAFLGIAERPADLGRRVHEGVALAMEPAQVRAARDWLRPQYEYVERTMGRLPQSWRRALTEV